MQARRRFTFAEGLANLVGNQHQAIGPGNSAILPPSRWRTQWGMREPPGQPAKHRSIVTNCFDKTHEPRVAFQPWPHRGHDQRGDDGGRRRQDAHQGAPIEARDGSLAGTGAGRVV